MLAGTHSPSRPRSEHTILRIGVLGIAVFVGTIAHFMTLMIWARAFGVVLFGQLALGLAVLSYATVLADFGTSRSLIIASSQNHEELAADTIVVKWLMAASILAVSFPLLSLILPVTAALLFSLGEGMLWGLQGRLSYHRGKGLIWPYVLAILLNWPLVLGMSLLFKPSDYATAAVVFAMPRLALIALLLIISSPPQTSASLHRLSAAIRQALPHGLVISLNNALLYVPVLGTGILFSAKELGLFQASWKIVGAASLISLPLSAFYFPELARLANYGLQPLRRAATRLMGQLVVAGLALTAVCALTSEYILRLAFGEAFSAGSNLLIMLSPILALRITFLVPETVLVVTANLGLLRRSLCFWLAVFLLSGIGGFALIGAAGYTLAYVLSYAGLVGSLTVCMARLFQSEAKVSAGC